MPKMVYKPVGITPYELIQKLKIKYPNYKKVAFTGRLDPMAHGEMLLLINEECKKLPQYLSFHKTYEYTILFGASTDTYDILGNVSKCQVSDYDLELILEKRKSLIGDYFQEFPPFSSKTVKYQGKMTPLWKIKDKSNIKLPTKRIKVNNIKYIKHQYFTKKKLLSYIQQRLDLVTSKDFDTKKFFKGWEKIPNNNYLIVKFVSTVSSGTYIREITNQLGNSTQYQATVLDIFRKKIILN